MDWLLYEFKQFARAYFDDIIVKFRSFDKHIYYLREIFHLFVDYNISIKTSKTFLGYESIDLLGQRVNAVGLGFSKFKLKAIAKIQFPSTLSKLETYLGIIKYLQKFILFYAGIAKPLQDLKTLLLRRPSIQGPSRQNFSTKTKIIASKQQSALFAALQKALTNPSILMHFDPEKPLYIDIDAFLDYGFGIVVFHTRSPEIFSKCLFSNEIQLLIFFSRLLSHAERNYWPTELEIVALVWFIPKLHHLIESSKHKIII